jgi:hypothetical protein
MRCTSEISSDQERPIRNHARHRTREGTTVREDKGRLKPVSSLTILAWLVLSGNRWNRRSREGLKNSL